jgi:RNA polymerase sigma-70 factor, ECF subfamily
MGFSDLRIQRRTRNDDIAAFEILFRKYYSSLVNYSNGFLKDRDASEEIVQEFFYNYWKNRKTIDIKISIKSYLFRSIRNNSLKYIDALAVRKRYADRVLNQSAGHIYENDEIEYTELNELIDGILEGLPERCSQIFRMSRFDGLKYDEIAAKLSVSVKTVEANMGKALRVLREKLKYYNQSGIF